MDILPTLGDRMCNGKLSGVAWPLFAEVAANIAHTQSLLHPIAGIKIEKLTSDVYFATRCPRTHRSNNPDSTGFSIIKVLEYFTPNDLVNSISPVLSEMKGEKLTSLT